MVEPQGERKHPHRKRESEVDAPYKGADERQCEGPFDAVPRVTGRAKNCHVAVLEAETIEFLNSVGTRPGTRTVDSTTRMAL